MALRIRLCVAVALIVFALFPRHVAHAGEAEDPGILGALMLPVYESGQMVAIELQEIHPSSPFAKAGLSAGDRITHVGMVAITSPGASAEALRLLAGRAPIRVRVRSVDGRERFISWPPEART